MSYIIDRRLNSKDKSAVNRQRFIKRYRKHIKQAVSDAVSQRSITDMERGEDIGIPQKDIEEPLLGHGQGGVRQRVLPGNKEFVTGDKIQRPKGGGSGAGDGSASDAGEGMDDFVFQITQDEFLEFMFEDLELPNLVRRQLAATETFKLVKAGISEDGTPNQLNVVRSMRSAYARRIALGAKKRRRKNEILSELKTASDGEALELRRELEEIERKLKKIPFIDDFDLKYNVQKRIPQPSSKAVMLSLIHI